MPDEGEAQGPRQAPGSEPPGDAGRSSSPPGDPTAEPGAGEVDLAHALLAAARGAADAPPVQGRRRAAGGPRPAAAPKDRPGTGPGASEDLTSGPGIARGGLSGPGPDRRDPQPLGRAVDRMVGERGWEVPVAVGGIAGRWPELVGAQVAEHCLPEGFADGVLTVRADSTAWATQVRLLAPTLVQRLNVELGSGTVRSVTVLGPSGPSWRKGRLRVPGRGPRDTYG